MLLHELLDRNEPLL
ncbi:hypothetical protein D031_2298, partial [Vibrio parahaemolyticus VP-48]